MNCVIFKQYTTVNWLLNNRHFDVYILKSVGRFMFNITLSLGCFVEVMLHVSSSTQQDWVIFIIEISDSDTIIKNGLLKAENITTNYYNYTIENLAILCICS